MDKRTSVKFMRETTISFQECIELTVVCLLAVAEQLGAVVATLHRHHVENMLPSINKIIKHLLRDGFCFLHRELAGITHNVACRILTAHVGIVVIVECIQMAAYQFIEKIDGGIVRPPVRHLRELANDISHRHVVRRTVEPVLDFFLWSTERHIYQLGLYRAQYLCRQVCSILWSFTIADKHSKRIECPHVAIKQSLVAFGFLGSSNLRSREHRTA